MVLFVVAGLEKAILDKGEVAIDLNLPSLDHATRIFAPFAEEKPVSDSSKFYWAAFCVKKDKDKLTFVSVN